jgi:hypothetical protein
MLQHSTHSNFLFLLCPLYAQRHARRILRGGTPGTTECKPVWCPPPPPPPPDTGSSFLTAVSPIPSLPLPHTTHSGLSINTCRSNTAPFIRVGRRGLFCSSCHLIATSTVHSQCDEARCCTVSGVLTLLWWRHFLDDHMNAFVLNLYVPFMLGTALHNATELDV